MPRSTEVELEPFKIGNPHLRELAGRLKSLSYRDMSIFSQALRLYAKDGVPLPDAILAAADEMASA